jgi:hypothetical protein
MIAYQDCRCAGCQNCATREFVDEYGERLPLCDRCPSPEEIRRRTAEVRASWDELDFWCRRYGLPRDVADDLRAVRVGEVAVIQNSLPLRHGKPTTPTEL